MSTPFQDALSGYLVAHAEYTSADLFAQPNRDEAERGLAQAGDALESVLRQMMREESGGGPFSLRHPATWALT